MATLKAKFGTEEEVNLGFVTGIVAFATGGQASATVLVKKWSSIDTVGSDEDSVKFPDMKIGAPWELFNNSLKILAIYPKIGEKINGILNYKFLIAPGFTMSFKSHVNGDVTSAGASI